MFGLIKGFDITIGNPPYVRADEQSDWNRRQREQILASKIYETLWEKWDLYVPFIERGYKLLKPGGVTTMIVSDAFCHSKYAQKPQMAFVGESPSSVRGWQETRGMVSISDRGRLGADFEADAGYAVGAAVEDGDAEPVVDDDLAFLGDAAGDVHDPAAHGLDFFVGDGDA